MNHRTALGALHIGALFFGLTGVFGKLAASASPAIIVFGRAAFAVLALALFASLAGPGWQRLSGQDARRLLLGGVLLAGHWVSFFIAVKVAGVAIATLGFASFPAFTVILEGLLFRERIEHNLQLMLRIAGGPERLRPHVKTHKLAPLVRRQIELGITKFKTSTIAETEMCAEAGAADILLAMPCVGPNAHRLAELARRFPTTRLATIADDEAVLRNLASAAQTLEVNLGVYLELDCGMGRTGIVPGEAAAYLVHVIRDTPRRLDQRS